jgi:hypothetical protein
LYLQLTTPNMYRVSQKLLCSKVPCTTLQFFLQQMFEMSPTGLKTCLDMLLHSATGVLSSGPWGIFPASAVGRTAVWYVVLCCTVTFGTLCIFQCIFTVIICALVDIYGDEVLNTDAEKSHTKTCIL